MRGHGDGTIAASLRKVGRALHMYHIHIDERYIYHAHGCTPCKDHEWSTCTGLPQMTGNGTVKLTEPKEIPLTSVLKVSAGAFHSMVLTTC